MPANILIDERQVEFRISANLADAKAVRIKRTLDSRRFLSALLRAVRDSLRQFPSLRQLRVQIR